MNTWQKSGVLLLIVFILLFIFTGNKNHKLENKLNKKDVEINKLIIDNEYNKEQTEIYIKQTEELLKIIEEKQKQIDVNKTKIKKNVKDNQEKSLRDIDIASSSISRRDSFWAVESTIQDTIIPFPR